MTVLLSVILVVITFCFVFILLSGEGGNLITGLFNRGKRAAKTASAAVNDLAANAEAEVSRLRQRREELKELLNKKILLPIEQNNSKLRVLNGERGNYKKAAELYGRNGNRNAVVTAVTKINELTSKISKFEQQNNNLRALEQKTRQGIEELDKTISGAADKINSFTVNSALADTNETLDMLVSSSEDGHSALAALSSASDDLNFAAKIRADEASRGSSTEQILDVLEPSNDSAFEDEVNKFLAMGPTTQS